MAAAITLYASPAYDSRYAARGCEGHPAPTGVNASGECGHVRAMDAKGGNPFKEPGPGQVATPVPHTAGRGGLESYANHTTHGRRYAGAGQ